MEKENKKQERKEIFLAYKDDNDEIRYANNAILVSQGFGVITFETNCNEITIPMDRIVKLKIKKVLENGK